MNRSPSALRHASIGAWPHPGQFPPRYRRAFAGASPYRRRSAWRCQFRSVAFQPRRGRVSLQEKWERVIRDSRLSDLNFYKLLKYGGQPPPAARYDPPLPCNGYCVECEAAGLVQGTAGSDVPRLRFCRFRSHTWPDAEGWSGSGTTHSVSP